MLVRNFRKAICISAPVSTLQAKPVTHDTHKPRCTSLHRCNSLDTSLQSSPTHRVAASHVRSALRNTSTRKHTRPGHPPTDHRSYTRTPTQRERKSEASSLTPSWARAPSAPSSPPSPRSASSTQNYPSPPSSRASQPGRPYPPPCSPPPPASRKGRL